MRNEDIEAICHTHTHKLEARCGCHKWPGVMLVSSLTQKQKNLWWTSAKRQTNLWIYCTREQWTSCQRALTMPKMRGIEFLASIERWWGNWQRRRNSSFANGRFPIRSFQILSLIVDFGYILLALIGVTGVTTIWDCMLCGRGRAKRNSSHAVSHYDKRDNVSFFSLFFRRQIHIRCTDGTMNAVILLCFTRWMEVVREVLVSDNRSLFWCVSKWYSVVTGGWWRWDALRFTEIHIDMPPTVCERLAQAIPQLEALVQRKGECTNSYMHHMRRPQSTQWKHLFYWMNELRARWRNWWNTSFNYHIDRKKKLFTWPMTAFDGAVISCCYHIPVRLTLSLSEDPFENTSQVQSASSRHKQLPTQPSNMISTETLVYCRLKIIFFVASSACQLDLMMIEYFLWHLWQFITRPFMEYYSLLNDARWLHHIATFSQNDEWHISLSLCDVRLKSIFCVHMKNDDWTNFTRIRHSIYLPIIYLPLLCTDFFKRRRQNFDSHTLLRKTVQFSHSQMAD